jgi:hypothetical protein
MVGGWRSKSEWREEGMGDQDDFVVRQRQRVYEREVSSMRVVWIPYYLLFLDGTKSLSAKVSLEGTY